MDVTDIAKLCHQVNKSYCESIGDISQLNWEDAPEWQRESAINGVKFHMAKDRNPSESHENWYKEKEADGWVYGKVKDPVKKTHPCMVPYHMLPVEQRSKDYIFKSICDFFRKEYNG